MTASPCICAHSRAAHIPRRGCLVGGCECNSGPGRRTPVTPAQRLLGESERTRLERRLARQIELAGLPKPETQYSWAQGIGRRFRSDFAYPEHRLLIEVAGGIWNAGRHVRPAGYQDDLRRLNMAQLLGWRVLQFTSEMIGVNPGVGEAVNTIYAAIHRLTLVAQEGVLSEEPKTRTRAAQTAGPVITKGVGAFETEQ